MFSEAHSIPCVESAVVCEVSLAEFFKFRGLVSVLVASKNREPSAEVRSIELPATITLLALNYFVQSSAEVSGAAVRRYDITLQTPPQNWRFQAEERRP